MLIKSPTSIVNQCNVYTVTYACYYIVVYIYIQSPASIVNQCNVHCNLCALLYCIIHDINVLLRIIRMTLKTNTGKYLTSNKTPIKGTKKDLPWRVSQSNFKEDDLSKTFSRNQPIRSVILIWNQSLNDWHFPPSWVFFSVFVYHEI